MWYVLLNKVSSNQQFDEMIMNINKVKNGTK
jgi:hypothetical protein